MIGTLPEKLKLEWPQHVSMLAHAYNCMRNDATGYRQHPLLPIDIKFGVFTPDISEVATHKFVQKLKYLEFAFMKAKESSMKEAKKNKL